MALYGIEDIGFVKEFSKSGGGAGGEKRKKDNSSTINQPSG